MLQRAFIWQEIDLLFKLRLIIQDLNSQFQEEVLSEPISVYIGNTVRQTQISFIEALRDQQNLVTIQHILFASTDRTQALARAEKRPHPNEQLSNLLVQIDIPSAEKCLIRFPQNFLSNNDGIDIMIGAGIVVNIITIDKNYQQNGYIFIHLQYVLVADQVDLREGIKAIGDEIQCPSPSLQLVNLLHKLKYQSLGEKFFSNLVNEENFIEDKKRQTALSHCLELLALYHSQEGNFKRASELFLLCMKACHRYLPVDHSSLYPIYRDLGELFYGMGEYQVAIDYFQKSFETQLHSTVPNLIYSAYSCYKLGLVYLKQGDDQNAIQALIRAEKILLQCGEPHPSELITIYDVLGEYYFRKEHYDESVSYYNKILEIQPDNPREVHTTHMTIALLYLTKEDYSNARIHYERAFDYARKYLPENNSTFILLHNNIGYTYYQEKQYSTALSHYSQGLLLAPECLPDNHSLIGSLLSNRALVYSELGRFNEAIESMEKSIEQFRKTLADDDEKVVHKQTLLEGIRRRKILHELIESEICEYF